MILYLYNDNKMVSINPFFTYTIASSVTKFKLYRESIMYYQNNYQCFKTSNLFVREATKKDSRRIK